MKSKPSPSGVAWNEPISFRASAFFNWLAAASAYPVLDLLAASLAWSASAGLAHTHLQFTFFAGSLMIKELQLIVYTIYNYGDGKGCI
jgi:hypothetical protein